MSLKKSTLYALTALFLVVLGSVPATAAPERNRYSDDELPLGRPSLDETRTTERVAHGVTYTRIERGEQSEEDFYTVDVAFKADRATAGPSHPTARSSPAQAKAPTGSAPTRSPAQQHESRRRSPRVAADPSPGEPASSTVARGW